MKFRCPCGEQIRDQTDALPYKARFLPDKIWFEIIEGAPDGLSANQFSDEILFKSLEAYQCSKCGRLFLSQANGPGFDVFTPESPDAKDIFDR